jgi:hypothetical protein
MVTRDQGQAHRHSFIQQQAMQLLAGVTQEGLEFKLEIVREAEWMLLALDKAERERGSPPLRLVSEPSALDARIAEIVSWVP